MDQNWLEANGRWLYINFSSVSTYPLFAVGHILIGHSSAALGNHGTKSRCCAAIRWPFFQNLSCICTTTVLPVSFIKAAALFLSFRHDALPCYCVFSFPFFLSVVFCCWSSAALHRWWSASACRKTSKTVETRHPPDVKTCHRLHCPILDQSPSFYVWVMSEFEKKMQINLIINTFKSESLPEHTSCSMRFKQCRSQWTNCVLYHPLEWQRKGLVIPVWQPPLDTLNMFSKCLFWIVSEPLK